MVVFTLVVSRTTTIVLCGMVMRTMPLKLRTRTSVAANVLKKLLLYRSLVRKMENVKTTHCLRMGTY